MAQMTLFFGSNPESNLKPKHVTFLTKANANAKAKAKAKAKVKAKTRAKAKAKV